MSSNASWEVPYDVSWKVTSFYIRVENQLAKAEYRLGQAARLPGLPGAAKILMGTIQAVVAFTVAFFSAIPAMGSKNARFIFLRSIAHIGHGFVNIGAGVAESIPGIGYISARMRERPRPESTFPMGHFLRYKYQRVFKTTNELSPVMPVFNNGKIT